MVRFWLQVLYPPLSPTLQLGIEYQGSHAEGLLVWIETQEIQIVSWQFGFRGFQSKLTSPMHANRGDSIPLWSNLIMWTIFCRGKAVMRKMTVDRESSFLWMSDKMCRINEQKHTLKRDDVSEIASMVTKSNVYVTHRTEITQWRHFWAESLFHALSVLCGRLFVLFWWAFVFTRVLWYQKQNSANVCGW